MTDWMARIVEAAEKQGFTVYQTDRGSWYFQRSGSNVVVMAKYTPHKLSEWNYLLSGLRSQGFRDPDDL